MPPFDSGIPSGDLQCQSLIGGLGFAKYGKRHETGSCLWTRGRPSGHFHPDHNQHVARNLLETEQRERQSINHVGRVRCRSHVQEHGDGIGKQEKQPPQKNSA